MHLWQASFSSCYTWSPSQEAPHSDWIFFTHTQKFTLRAVWFYELWLTHDVRYPSHYYYREYCQCFLDETLCHQTLSWSLTTTTWLLHPCFCLFITPCNWHHLICGLWTGLLSFNKRHLHHLCGCEDQSTSSTAVHDCKMYKSSRLYFHAEGHLCCLQFLMVIDKAILQALFNFLWTFFYSLE